MANNLRPNTIRAAAWHLDDQPLGVDHPDLLYTLVLGQPFLLHGHGDQLSNPHRCLEGDTKGKKEKINLNLDLDPRFLQNGPLLRQMFRPRKQICRRASCTHLACTLEHDGVVAHLALGDAECSQESSHSHCSGTWRTSEDRVEKLDFIDRMLDPFVSSDHNVFLSKYLSSKWVKWGMNDLPQTNAYTLHISSFKLEDDV